MFPYHTKPGFWYLYEIAFGSHPKAFRHPIPLEESGNTSPERARSGVIHWGLGIRLWHDPDAPTESKKWAEFSKKNNTPFDHGWHTHTYFTTYKVRLRNADKWVALLDKGRMTSLDDPEVRALASRYGNPDDVLAEDWIPEVPGHQRSRGLLEGLCAEPGSVRDQGARKGEQRYLRALLPEDAGPENDEQDAAGTRQAGREITQPNYYPACARDPRCARRRASPELVARESCDERRRATPNSSEHEDSQGSHWGVGF